MYPHDDVLGAGEGASHPAPLTPVASVPLESTLLLRREDFDELLDCAAQRGAERVLMHLGLENGRAAKDIRELRDLLEAWRDARRTAWQTTVKVVTTGILAVLLVGMAFKLKLLGGAQ